ncbi:hypothetical protein HaLaN_05809 [Haematococcus lacustris]|uniref:Uncharacterized protein n=1 Tax=Haematococcus lacustris TaxID=44745 RepID=A0A699YJS4_HAELA|nr:hypothetical protein HaLaN_05809 [Haematococcus lacustris]
MEQAALSTCTPESLWPSVKLGMIWKRWASPTTATSKKNETVNNAIDDGGRRYLGCICTEYRVTAGSPAMRLGDSNVDTCRGRRKVVSSAAYWHTLRRDAKRSLHWRTAPYAVVSLTYMERKGQGNTPTLRKRRRRQVHCKPSRQRRLRNVSNMTSLLTTPSASIRENILLTCPTLPAGRHPLATTPLPRVSSVVQLGPEGHPRRGGLAAGLPPIPPSGPGALMAAAAGLLGAAQHPSLETARPAADPVRAASAYGALTEKDIKERALKGLQGAVAAGLQGEGTSSRQGCAGASGFSVRCACGGLGWSVAGAGRSLKLVRAT